MRILLIDTAASMKPLLTAEGFNVTVAEDGEDGIECARMYDYDLILLDVASLRRVRMAGVATPAIVLADDPSPTAVVAAFGAGADDYMVRPVQVGELVARAGAVIRRSQGHAEALITAGPIVVNVDAKHVSVGGKDAGLTGKEYVMVEMMALRLGQTVTKAQFMDHLYGGRDADEPEIKIIDVFVCKIRTKLRRLGGGGHIQTVWGAGYRMSPVASEDSQPRKGTTASISGRVLALLALTPKVARSRVWVSENLGVQPAPTYSGMKLLHEKQWVERQGHRETASWSITPAGIAENARRLASDTPLLAAA